MRLKEIQLRFHQDLEATYSIDEIDSFFYILIDHFYKLSRIQLALNPETIVQNEALIFNALDLLKQQKPIQYIIGETEFYGLSFKVNENVLIPRPETEELVDWVLEFVTDKKGINILDIGTGSGSIAISLAKKVPHANVYALDVSKEALKVAQDNAKLNHVTMSFIEADILALDKINDLNFDIIVSNPPYVREQEKALMKPNVLENEPHLALFVEDHDALQFYKAIINFSEQSLSNDGMLFFEINEYLGNEMLDLLRINNFSKLELKQDIFKKDRMVKGVKS